MKTTVRILALLAAFDDHERRHDRARAARAAGGEHAAEHADKTGGAEEAEHEGGHHGPAPHELDRPQRQDASRLHQHGDQLRHHADHLLRDGSEGRRSPRASSNAASTIGKDIEDAQKMLAEAQERAKKYQGDLKNVPTSTRPPRRLRSSAAGRGEVERMLILESGRESRAHEARRRAPRRTAEKKQIRQDLMIGRRSSVPSARRRKISPREASDLGRPRPPRAGAPRRARSQAGCRAQHCVVAHSVRPGGAS